MGPEKRITKEGILRKDVFVIEVKYRVHPNDLQRLIEKKAG
jgi:hypothetical protein